MFHFLFHSPFHIHIPTFIKWNERSLQETCIDYFNRMLPNTSQSSISKFKIRRHENKTVSGLLFAPEESNKRRSQVAICVSTALLCSGSNMADFLTAPIDRELKRRYRTPISSHLAGRLLRDYCWRTKCGGVIEWDALWGEI